MDALLSGIISIILELKDFTIFVLLRNPKCLLKEFQCIPWHVPHCFSLKNNAEHAMEYTDGHAPVPMTS